MSGAGPIGFSSVDRYAARFGIDDVDSFEAFAAAIAAMDDVFLGWQAERRKAETKQK